MSRISRHLSALSGYWSLLLALLAGVMLEPQSLSAQIQFIAAPPEIDSFPIVRSYISVSENGGIAPITNRDLQILEDGVNVPNFELINCDESSDASIALLVDISGSMDFTVQINGVREYINAYSEFFKHVPFGSEISLIPFNDTVWRHVPGYYGSKQFFQAAVTADTSELKDSLTALRFGGNTDVDFAIGYAVQVLKASTKSRKAIVLVTDDGIFDERWVSNLLKKSNTPIFILELDKDTIQGNLSVSIQTGGKLLVPRDSSEYAPMMALIAKAIFGKRCIVRYESNHPCPWWSRKTLWFGLKYKASNLTQTHYFHLGSNKRDSIPPTLTVTNSSPTSRFVLAEEIFPCNRGIRSFTDSGLVNFSKLRREFKLPNSAWDTIAVIDPRMPAHGYYIAVDSSGNRGVVEVTYEPPGDLLPPTLTQPILTGQQYATSIAEIRPWDSGIERVWLSSAINLKVDSVVYQSQKRAMMYASIIDRFSAASGCVAAQDSAGNIDSICVRWNGLDKDNLPPQFQQDVQAQPRTVMSGRVTEMRTGDAGLMQVTVTSLVNSDMASSAIASRYEAFVRSSIKDSMYPARAYVNALDSLGNSVDDTLRYEPLPDLLPPALSSSGTTTIMVTAKESAAWDRGLVSVTQTASSNASISALTFVDRTLATLTVTAVDPYQRATASFIASDSAGNSSVIDVVIAAQTKLPLAPLEVTEPLVFPTTPAPAYLYRYVIARNPNDDIFILESGSMAGNDSVFSYAGGFPVMFGPGETLQLPFVFTPTLVGNWSGTYTFVTSTGDQTRVRLQGASTGEITVRASNESVAWSGESGTLEVTFTGTPNPLNVDRIQFTLQVNTDNVRLGTPVIAGCTGADDLCNYTVTSTDRGDGKYDVELVRKSDARSLEFTSRVEIPFTTYLAPTTTTPVYIVSPTAFPLTTATYADGRIAVGNTCGDSLVRLVLNNQLDRIERIEIDAASVLMVDLNREITGAVDVQVLDLRGSVIATVHHDYRTPTRELRAVLEPLASGTYIVSVRTSTLNASRLLQITR